MRYSLRGVRGEAEIGCLTTSCIAPLLLIEHHSMGVTAGALSPQAATRWLLAAILILLVGPRWCVHGQTPHMNAAAAAAAAAPLLCLVRNSAFILLTQVPGR